MLRSLLSTLQTKQRTGMPVGTYPLSSTDINRLGDFLTLQRPCLFPIIISLSLEISDNPTKRLDYFRFSGNPLQRFELREARIEKRENLRFSRQRLDYKLSENKQGLNPGGLLLEHPLLNKIINGHILLFLADVFSSNISGRLMPLYRSMG